MSASIKTTPLFVAIQEGNFDTAKALVARGANTNRVNGMGISPLMSAASDDPDMVKILLELGADPNFFRPSDGANALSSATHDENKQRAARTVELLIKAGADVEMPIDKPQSVLMLAARNDLAEVAELLLEAGADPDRVCSLNWALGWTALDHAINERSRETEAVLRKVTTRTVIATPGIVS
jgi:ankyrin repeat protein